MSENKAGHVVIPAILAHSEETFRAKIERVRPLGVMVQIDVMDGTFVDNTSWADPALVPDILAGLPFEVHLMTDHPERHIVEWLHAGAERIWFHIEATTDPHAVITAAGGDVGKIGVALNPGTPCSVLNSTIRALQRVLVMGVEPGWSGQTFKPEALEHIAMIAKNCPETHIVVDGGVNEVNVASIRAAGAHEVVVGSALTDAEDPRAAYETFTA